MFPALAFLSGNIALAFGAFNSSRILHTELLHCILRQPVSFFEITPIGRVLSRLSLDVDILDNRVPLDLRQAIIGFFRVRQ